MHIISMFRVVTFQLQLKREYLLKRFPKTFNSLCQSYRFDELAEQFNIKEELIANIRARGYLVPTPIQMQAIPLMLKKREILACAPTGSGKTAAFLVPIIHCLGTPQKKGFRAVIVSPTRELANQTHRECVKLTEEIGLRCHVIDNVGKAAQKFGPKSSQRFGN